MAFNTSQSPWFDNFDISNKWSQLLFEPSRPLFQKELNESQSLLLSQISLLGNSEFKEGAIISGMALTPLGNSSDGSTGTALPDGVNPNLIHIANVSSYNSKIDISGYKTNGSIGIQTTASLAGDYPGLQFVTSGASDNEFTLSFSVKKDSGVLYKLSGIYDSSLTVEDFLIDGHKILTSFNDMTSTLLVDTSGNQINLNDGNSHNVQVTFSGEASSSYTITVVANAGYNALKEGVVNYTLSSLKSETGDTPTAWVLADGDQDTNTGDERNQSIQVSDGYVYLNGMVRKFDEQTINISGVGTEKIGVSLSEYVVTSKDDPTLTDNTPGTASQWKAGADRLVYNVSLTYNDPSAANIYNLKDGKIDNSSSDNNTSEQLNDLLAKRTNGESGSYRVNGFGLWSEKDNYDSSEIDLVVDKGTAYVLGYQIIKGVSTRIPIPKATGTATIADEVLVYSSGSGSTYTGQLANQPVKEINQVTGNVQVLGEAVTRGANLATNDTLKYQAFEVNKVYSYDSNHNETDYTFGTDFSLVNGNQIQWGTTSNSKYPNAGTTYYVDYLYENVFKEGTDFVVNTVNSDALAITSIDFSSNSGTKPANDTQIHVSYDYFLARVDTLTLDSKGNFNIVSGKEDKLIQVQPAAYIDPNTLILGYVTVYPNSDQASVQSQSVTRIPFSGLQDLVSRVQNIESTLQTEVSKSASYDRQDPTTINGFFTENFTDYNMADLGNKEFTARENLNAGQITIDDEISSELPLVEDTTSSTVTLFEDLITPNFTETPYISQSLATGVVNINPFDSYKDVGDLVIDPSTDSWINESKTTVNTNKQGNDTGYGDSKTKVEDGTTSVTTTTDTATEYIRPRTINFTASNLMPLSDNLVITMDGVTASITPDKDYTVGTLSGSIKSDGNGTAKGSFVIPNNIRTGSREVSINNPTNTATAVYTANGIERLYTTTNTDNWHYNYYEEYYYTPSYYTPAPDDTPTYVAPSAPSGHYVYETYTRNRNGSYTSSNGDYYASSGYLKNDYNSGKSGWWNDPNSHTITTETWVTDPVAQSFHFDKSGVVSSLRLYFASVPDSSSLTKADVRVELRNMDSGFPGINTVAYGVLSPSDIVSSKDGSVATKVQLNQPVWVSKGDSYAMAIITSSDAYSLYQATIGENDILSGNPVSSTAYIGGSFFESRNAQTWSAILNTSLKFDVLMDTFEPTGVETYQPIQVNGNYFTDYLGSPVLDAQGNLIPLLLSRIVLLTRYITPDNTSINFQFRYVLDKQPTNVDINTLDWQPFYDNTDVIFREKIRTIQFRTILNSSSDGSIAPAVSKGSTNLIAYKVGTSGVYVSSNLTAIDSPFNHLRVQYDAAMPDNSNIVLQYSVDGGSTWNTFDNGYTKTVPLSSSVNRYSYDLQLYKQASGDTTTAKQIKFRIAMNKPDNFGDLYVMAFSGSMGIQDGNELGNDGWSAVTKYDTVVPGVLLWSNDGTVINPTISLSQNISSLRNGLIIKFVDKLNNVNEITINSSDLTTGKLYGITINSDNGSVTKSSDNSLTFAGFTSNYPFEVDAN